MLPLDPDKVLQVLRALELEMASDSSATTLVDRIAKSEHLQRLASNPLHLSLLASVANDSSSIESRWQLYSAFFRSRLN